MFDKLARFVMFSILIVAICAVSFVVFPREFLLRSKTLQTTAQTTQERSTVRHRNLLLQPDAANLARRIGRRFGADKNERSIIDAIITVKGERRAVRMVRQQKLSGEHVDIVVEASPTPMSWDGDEGVRASGIAVQGTDREIVERLVLDSVDQFVLAQLRGASYFTVARNVRPTDAGDYYSGPTWTIIRVNDPQSDEVKRAESLWRLYYINTSTGLIDRIESEVRDQRVTAEIIEWAEIDNEKVPRQILWKRNDQTVMQYTLVNFTHSES